MQKRPPKRSFFILTSGAEVCGLDLLVCEKLIAGAGHCNEKAVRVLVTEGPEVIADMMNLGVPFDRDETCMTVRCGASAWRRGYPAGVCVELD